jgi:hypothetical protein
MAWEVRNSLARSQRRKSFTSTNAKQNAIQINMKTTPSKTTHGSHCLPIEAYIRLWNASATTQQTPKIKSTYTPKKK